MASAISNTTQTQTAAYSAAPPVHQKAQPKPPATTPQDTVQLSAAAVHGAAAAQKPQTKNGG